MYEYKLPHISQSEIDSAFSPVYRELWNEKVQKQIDDDIEAHRKGENEFLLPPSAAGREINVEQISHDFIFGAHIFNFDQLGSDERNRRYKELYGTLFNSATIAFYWKTHELQEGFPRYRSEYKDTAEYWNKCAEPWKEPHWRRPPTNAVVDFCLSKKIRLHGHPLVWGNNTWHLPDWLMNKLPFDYLLKANLIRNPENGRLPTAAMSEPFKDMTPEEIEKALPEFVSLLNVLTAKRIIELAIRYGDKIDSWDVVNESACDYASGNMIPGSKICKSCYGPMPGDYTYRSFKIAESVLPDSVKLNINDYYLQQPYLEQINDLRSRGCKIDIAGAQMHLFNPQQCQDIADGTSLIQSPDKVREAMGLLSKAGLPIHLSEITITAPGGNRKGEIIQAVISRNLYRLWFSLKPMMGITWWNVVDNCGAPGEPSVSGLFTRDMQPKLSYFALNDLINNEWKTRLTAQADKEGKISFRGFRGNYKFTWLDAQGNCESMISHLQ